jgi:tRNA threonylcarbamoyladenosine biosynthesis protein TsaB
MLTLTVRTDKPEAELGLFENEVQLAYSRWEAHRQLAETIHQKLQKLLSDNIKELKDINAIVVYHGPGSFTGLRIGMSVANALAQSLHIPIVGETSEGWIAAGQKRLQNGGNEHTALPEYGADPHITTPKH